MGRTWWLGSPARSRRSCSSSSSTPRERPIGVRRDERDGAATLPRSRARLSLRRAEPQHDPGGSGGGCPQCRAAGGEGVSEEWGLSLGGRRMLAGRWVLLGRSQFDVNHVPYLGYRSTTIAGLGYFVVKSPRVSLLLAPGLGYGKSEQTAYGRVLSFAAGIPASVEGPITGVHDMLTVQLTPMLSFQQDMHYFWSLRASTPYRQAEFNAKLLGMVTTHFGLSVAFKEQYDSSMPPPVN